MISAISLGRRLFSNQFLAQGEFVNDINNLFRFHIPELELVSFYETSGIRSIGVSHNESVFLSEQIVVPEHSACLGVPGERSVALNGNHFEIVRFSSSLDPNYRVVLTTIDFLITRIISSRMRVMESESSL